MEFYLELLLTAIISVLLAFLLGKLFSDEADRDPQATKIADGSEGNDSRSSDQINASDVSSREKRRGIEKGFEVDEVKSDEISARRPHDEVKTEKFVGDFGGQLEEGEVITEVGVSELGDARDDDDSRIIEQVGPLLVKGANIAEDNSLREMSEDGESECCKEAEEPHFDAVDASRTETEVEVERIDECGKDVAGLREEKAAVKEGYGDEKGQSLLVSEDDDEWEGIEQTELHKRFHRAAAYVGTEGGEFALPSLSDEEQMQLYGLHKVATEGPCYESQPMALKVSARAKWNAWQRLGNMNPDVAMERYMSLLSEKVPDWTGEKSKGDDEKHERSEVVEAASSGDCTPFFCSNVQSQLSGGTERRQDFPSPITEEIESATTEHAGQGPNDG